MAANLSKQGFSPAVTSETFGETSFFRHPAQFDHLVRTELPPRLTKPGKIKLWSAGCSIGAEPLTIALCMKHYLPRYFESKNWMLLASDINPEALEAARVGLFSDWCVRSCPAALKQQSFKPSGENWQIGPDLASKIDYFQHDLLNQTFPSEVDIVFCRNVLIYFEQSKVKEILQQLALCLKPSGVIYLGYAEAVAATQIAGLEIVDPDVAMFRKKDYTAEPLAQNRQLKTGTVQPEPMESNQKAMTHLQAAEIYADQDQAELALHSLRQSVGLDPNLGAAHYRIGLLELSLGNQESASYHWNQVLLIAATRMAQAPVAGWKTCTWGQLRIWTERKLRNIRAI